MKNVVIILFVCILTGCVSSSPVNNEEFKSIRGIEDLQGAYRNNGDSGKGGPTIYLSRIIWPADESLKHEDVDIVEIQKLDDKKIEITALQNEIVKRNGIFEAGKEFNIENGRITINREGGVAGFKSGEPMLGLYYGNVTLGLDKAGHGKYRSSGAAAGMVFMVIPMAMSAQDDVRFERVR